MKWIVEPLPYEKVFRDPIHDYIHVNDKVILDLINTKEFQRLRRIKQLGTTSLTFHGAEHTRFGHSLGVYEVTRQICEMFARQYPKEKEGKDGWDNDERIVALCAALLHDIGHGAYSHTFEFLFNTNHEEIGIEIILSPDTEVNAVLRQVHTDFPQTIADVIAKKYPNSQVVHMISSQADADRMDYLLRDAYYTGVEYGVYDLTRILRVMRPYRNGICFHDTGMHAVEDYIISRYQMFMQVYFHPVSRGMEVVLQRLLERAQFCYQKQPEYFDQHCELLVPFLKADHHLEDYLRLDDGVLNTYFQLWLQADDPILRDLADRFVNRKPFKSIKVEPGVDLRHLRKLSTLLEHLGFDPHYYAALNSASDVPYDIYRARKHHPKTQIELRREDGSLIELSALSEMVHSLSGETKLDQRFYFPREILKPDDSYKNRPEITDFQRYIKNGTFHNDKGVTIND